MAISVQRLFEQAAREFGFPATSEKCQSDFLDALNRALVDLEILAIQDSSEVDNLGGDIAVDRQYEPAISLGTAFHLTMMGHKAVDDKRDYYTLYRDAMRSAQMYYHRDNATTGKFG